jgi:uncharacterized RDD family membrane protein YckC
MYNQIPDTLSNIQYAGFWRRVGSFIVDASFITLCLSPFLISLLIIQPPKIDYNDPFNSPIYNQYVDYLIQGVYLIYFCVLDSSKWQGTLGKRAFKIKVIGTNGNPISFWRALIRYAINYCTAITFCIGYIVFPFSKNKQFLHDMLCKTLVIKQ